MKNRDEEKGNIGNGTTHSIEPTGLPNIGSTCFMNSILQCLIWTPMIKQQLENVVKRAHSDERALPSATKSSEVKALHLTQSLLKLVIVACKMSENRANRPIMRRILEWLASCFRGRETVPKKNLQQLLVAIREKNNQFNGFNQQDSFEMFNTIISGIEEETLSLEENSISEKPTLDTQYVMNNCPVSRLFGGMFITEYKYSSCDHIEPVFQRFTSICVPVQEETVSDKQFEQEFDVGTASIRNVNYDDTSMFQFEQKCQTGVETGLEVLTKMEQFSNEDLPCRTCDKADINGYCTKRLMIASPPPILVLQLNRVKHSEVCGRLEKIQTEISYPDTLDFTPFISKIVKDERPNVKNVHYSLYGVVCHNGPISRGHYYAYIKCTQKDTFILEEFMEGKWSDPENMSKQINGKEIPSDPEEKRRTNMAENMNDDDEWYYISDSHVKKIINPFGDSGAYILMYQRNQ